jgi:cytochrome bd ubiquinol oxidase subunit II
MTLQIAWFVLVGMLFTGYAVLDGFDLGVGFWHPFAKKDEERRLFIKAIGPVWDGNEVWLLTAGGALFAAFPPVYASVFSGFYLAMMLVLFGLIFRASALEFRHQVDSPGWKRAWDMAFHVGSTLPALLYGVAVGNLVRGLQLNEAGDYIGGFFALLNPYALVVGLTGLAMFVVHGALYLTVKTEGELADKTRSWASKAWFAFASLFVVTAVWSLVAHQRGSLIGPLVAAVVALGFIVAIKLLNRAGADLWAFISSAGAIVAMLIATGATLFPSLAPSIDNPALSLTIYNSSASQYSLTIMLIFALLGMPMVIGYTIFIYRVFAGKVSLADEGY